MNIGDAIDIHVKWKNKLRSAIAKREAIDVTVTKDDTCELGKWLNGEGGQNFGNKVCFQNLVAAHAAFHRSIGFVVEAINAKNYASAEFLLGEYSEFEAASKGVVAAIEAAKNQL